MRDRFLIGQPSLHGHGYWTNTDRNGPQRSSLVISEIFPRGRHILNPDFDERKELAWSESSLVFQGMTHHFSEAIGIYLHSANSRDN